MLDEELLEKVLKKALSRGGDYADVFVEWRRPTGIRLEDDRIEEIVSGQEQGVGIRLIWGGRSAYAISNDLGPEALLEAADSVSKAARGSDGEKSIDLRAVRPSLEFAIGEPPGEVSMERKVSLLKEANAAARGKGGMIRQVSLYYRDLTQRVRMANSEGAFVDDERIQLVGVVNVIAEKDGVIQTGYEPIGGFAGFEFFEENSLAEVALRAADRALMMLEARRAPGGRMPVVISSEAGGTMIHEAIGHGLEADLAGQGLSRYSGMLGKEVASPLVTVVDDATLPGRRGSYRFDDEGTPSQSTVLVKDGVLTGFLYDRLNAMRDGARSTGNGRRESYLYRPIPRMSNTFIAPGASDPAEVLRSTPRGLLVVKMGGGQVNTVGGDFVFDVQEGYLIEDGRRGEPVRGATLTGSGPEVLKSIDMVGSDLGFAIGTCGKDGQGAPVSDAMPTVRIPEMVVGGEV
ncbi:MAG: TldD/PmbA family protein [Nitrospirota bacterium]|jgi:TldD protein